MSDKIFEPAWWRRAWAAFWGSSGRLGFAGAAMLSAAILFSVWTRPAPAPGPRMLTTLTTATTAAAAPVSSAEVERQVQAAVAKALVDVEASQSAKVKQVVAELEDARRRLVLAEANYDLYEKRANIGRMVASSYAPKPDSAGDGK